ncbi:hypothetical protein CS0771_45650 [Catellatospora sp. IY07-71]|uniref:hypothetical protein n=1 Tax=Catellatospora sp. IY07-71 TaxID=2728827 RepID=UPI001BB40729|nr:hypothetical protein [Catellatospora sp. IY07-71]BCJ75021.1 hypothetical protein CS0771_45650 [Catellatospora sp. IY07-71]
MTTGNRSSPCPTATGLPEPNAVLRDTEWADPDLYTAIGDAQWVPATLRALLDPDPAAQSKALDDLEPVSHQSSIYPATVPVAQYIAAILADPRTATDCMFGWWREPKDRRAPLRSELIIWLRDLIWDAEDSPHDDPDVAAVLAMRPTLFTAIAPFLHDDDPTTRLAALAAAVLLTEDRQLVHHRAEIAERVGIALDGGTATDPDIQSARDTSYALTIAARRVAWR